MSKQTLKDRYNNTIGYIETNSSGKQTIKDKYNSVRGTYDPKTNITKDKYNNTVGKGNLLVTLL
jgi:hypothetical protein